MKAFVAVILALGSVSALGSGPYLPSGWRPHGPAFFLPNEQKPADEPTKEVIVVETIASGSDSLREYGPPKVQEVTETVINQGLPDVVTEQTFYMVEEKSANVEENIEAETSESGQQEEESSPLIEETTALVEITPTAEVRAVEVEIPEVTTASYTADTTATIAEKLEEVLVEEDKVVQEVKSIAEAIVNLENEVKIEQVQAVEVAAELKGTQEGSGSSVPEGFLEYGPPGFKEYGPPKGDELLRAAVDSTNAFEYTNEARRRRFSPKFRSQKNKRHH